jgi:parvulin-like peptidyl-prolyl isomerase
MYLRFSVLLAASVTAAMSADVRVVEEIVAKVNGDIITRSEVDHTRQMMAAELKQQGLNGAKLAQELKQREKDALRDQIDQLLLVQKGKDLNINVDPDVTRRIAEIQVQSKIADPDKFHEWLREQTGITFDAQGDLRMRVQEQGGGVGAYYSRDGGATWGSE